MFDRCDFSRKQKNQKTIYKFSLIFTIILVVLFLYLLNIRHKKQKLEQTRITLDEVKRTLVADLRRINDEDYSQLDIEMELNKIE